MRQKLLEYFSSKNVTKVHWESALKKYMLIYRCVLRFKNKLAKKKKEILARRQGDWTKLTSF